MVVLHAYMHFAMDFTVIIYVVVSHSISTKVVFSTLTNFYFTPNTPAQTRNSTSACLYACSSVCLCISRTSPNFTKFSVHVTTCGRGSVLLSWQCDVTYSRFVDDVMFSYDAGNIPESKMTCMFHSVHQVAAPGTSLPSLTAP